MNVFNLFYFSSSNVHYRAYLTPTKVNKFFLDKVYFVLRIFCLKKYFSILFENKTFMKSNFRADSKVIQFRWEKAVSLTEFLTFL